MSQMVAAIQEYAIFMLDAEGRVISWNQGAERIKGYSFDEIKGKHFSCFYPEEIAKSDKPQRELDIAVKKGIFEEEGLRIRKDGSSFWASVVLTPVYDERKKLLGFAKITRDVSERRKADVEVKRSNQALEQFAYVAAHDLQEPLRSITSYLDLLAERYHGQLDAKADKYIGNAVQGARRMQQLIADLLAYSRVSTKSQKLEKVDCDVLLAEVMNDLHAGMDESHARFVLDELPTVLCDRGQLGQVFRNLLSNSIKYRGSMPLRIEINAQKLEPSWLFTFKDNGIGFDPQYAERIFLIFQRLHGRKQYSGNGIGLSICQRIIERHGGTIWANAEPNKGATFQFTIPA